MSPERTACRGAQKKDRTAKSWTSSSTAGWPFLQVAVLPTSVPYRYCTPAVHRQGAGTSVQFGLFGRIRPNWRSRRPIKGGQTGTGWPADLACERRVLGSLDQR